MIPRIYMIIEERFFISCQRKRLGEIEQFLEFEVINRDISAM